MTHENTPDTTVDAPEAAVEAPKRRRRATRAVTTPGTIPAEAVQGPSTPADEAETAAAPVADEAAPAADEVAPVAEAPAPKKTRKRATRAIAAAPEAPAAEAPAEPQVAEATGAGSDEAPVDAPAEAAPTDAATAEAAPAAKAAPKRRRASSRPAAAPVPVEAPVATVADAPADADETTVEDADEQPEEAVAVAEAAEDAVEEAAAEAPALDVLAELAAAPARSRRGGRSGRSRRGAAAADAEDAAAPEAPAEDEQAPAEPQAPAATGSPRLATTALLFQVPDPSAARPRRRRATSSAGSPEAISEAARAERAAEQADADAPVEGADLEQSEAAPAEGAPRSRGGRRRGGRGRGAARSEDAEAEATTDDVTEAEDASAEEAWDEALDATAASEAADDTESAEGDEESGAPRRRRRRGGRGRRRPDNGGNGQPAADDEDEEQAGEPDGAPAEDEGEPGEGGTSRRRRRRRGSRSGDAEGGERTRSRTSSDEVTALRGSTRLEAKRQRRREGRDAGRRRQIISEAEFLARRESVERTMIVREKDARTQIAVLEDGVLVEHYVSNQAQTSMVGNVYLGRVQNVLPSMEAAFIDVGKGRNAVLYAGEVNWDAAGLEGQPRRIEQALKSGDSVLVQVTKDPIGHKGARLTSQVTLAGRYLVYVPGGGMTGISRKLPDTERNRLKRILREVVPDSAGVIVRTAAEGASEEELRADIARLQGQWEAIEKKARTASAPALLQGEPDMAIRVVRDIFNDDFSSLVVQGSEAWSTISSYIDELAPDLAQKVSAFTGTGDVFAAHRIDEQLAKGMDRKVWLPSGGSLVIDRTEAMTVVDVNTGKFTGSGGTLEETVTRNNLEAAEEIVRQLRLRDIGGIIVIDFIDMVLESNRDLVLRRLVECLGRDRTKHQVAEVTSLGLVQMTRKRVGQGLVEAFSETCEHCHGRGFIVHSEPIEKSPRPDAGAPQAVPGEEPKRARRKRGASQPAATVPHAGVPVLPAAREEVKATLATIAAAAAHAHEHDHREHPAAPAVVPAPVAEPVDEADVAIEERPGTPAAEAELVDTVLADGETTDAPADAVVAEVARVDGTPEAPVVPVPVLDVLAEFAGSRPARAEAAPVVAVTPVITFDGDDAPLELTPVSPDLFAGDGDIDDEAGHEADGSDEGTDGTPSDSTTDAPGEPGAEHQQD